MSKHIEYHHFLISPRSYLAIGRFNDLVLRTGASVDYLPINLTPAFFPADQTLAAAMVYAAAPGERAAHSDAILTAVWRDERNIADPATLQDSRGAP